MKKESDFVEVRKLIELALSEDLLPSSIDQSKDIYLSFAPNGIHLLTQSEHDCSNHGESIFQTKILEATQVSDYNRYEYEQLSESLSADISLHMDSSYFRYQRSIWRAFLVDPSCYSRFIQDSLPNHQPWLLIRLTRIVPFELSESFERRLLGLLNSSSDLLLLVEDQSHVLTLSKWLTNHSHSIEYPIEGSTQVLPMGWRWLHINEPLHSERRGHWLTHRIYLINVSNIQQYLADTPLISSNLKWLVTLSRNSVCKHAVRTQNGWMYLDDLSDEAWMVKTRLTLHTSNNIQNGLNESPSPSMDHVPSIAPNEVQIPLESDLVSEVNRSISESQSDPDDIEPDIQKSTPVDPSDSFPFIVDYEEVLSGISSESSTIQVSVQTVEQTPGHSPNTANTKTPVETLKDLLDPDDLDHSEVLDISLSELPIQTHNQTIPEQKNEFDDPSFTEVKHALKQGLVIDRNIPTPLGSPHSLVTTPDPTEDEGTDDSFIYNTINQSPRVESIQDFPTFNEQPRFEDPSSHLYETSDSTQVKDISQSDALESIDDLPTRIDIDSSDVFTALDQERQDEVTRVVQPQEDHHARPITTINDHQLEEDVITRIDNASLDEKSIEHDRVEALSRENTAKLKVRDFDMLTDIKERLPTPPPPPRPPPPPPVKPIPSRAPPPIHSDSSVSSARYSDSEIKKPSTKSHKDRRSFSDVIRSLTTKNKP